MKNKFKVSIILGGILLTVFSIALFKVYTLCYDNSKSYNAMFDARIYENAQYNLGGSGLELTEQGIDIRAWNYNSSKYLKITTNLPKQLHSESTNFIIAIKLPREFYFSVNDFLLPIGCSKVEFKKNDDFTVNTNSVYKVNNHSGTVYYTVNPGVTTINIQLEIKYDFELWNKLGNSLINQRDQKSIEVKLLDSNIDNLLFKKSINNSYSDKEYSMVSGIYTYINNDRNQNKEIKLLYNNRNAEKIKYRFFMIPKTQSVIKTYYKELKLKIKLPEYVDKNKIKHYMIIDKNSIDFRTQTGGIPEYTFDDTDIKNGNVTLIYKNVYLSTEKEMLLWYNLRVPDIEGLDKDAVINFTRAETHSYVIDNMGFENRITSSSAYNISFFMSAKENVEIRNFQRDVSYRASFEKNIVYLGGLFLSNSGTGDSNKKHVDILFDVENSGYMKITAMNLPIYSDVKIYDIKYRLVDENNTLIYKDEYGNYIADNERGKNYEFNIKINWAGSNVNKLVFNRNLLPEKERKYFFKQIKYDIEKIKAGKVLYEPSSIANYDNIGNYFGYVNYKKYEDKAIHTKFTISSEGMADLEYVEATYFRKIALAPYSISNLLINDKVSNSQVIAGNSIKIGGEVEIPYYPYGNLHWINNIVIGFVLPDGIDINKESIVLATKKNKAIKPLKLEQVNLYNGNKMWKIYAPTDLVIGFANENIDVIENGRFLKFEVVLDVSDNIEGQTLNLNKILYVTTTKFNEFEPIYNGSNGSLEWSKKVDKYDLNGDGKTDDIIGGVNDSNKLSFKIIPENDFFRIKDSINVNNGDYSKNVEISKEKDLLNYKISLKFSKNATFENFAYYIPIPKKSSGIDKYMIKTKDKIFDLALNSQVEVLGDDLYTVLYTLKGGINIDVADFVEWVTADKIYNFNDVAMIKIVPKKSGVLNPNTEINVKLKYSGNDFDNEVGNKIELNSAAKIKYLNNGNVTEGIFGTKGVTIDAKSLKELSDITLTAAPDRKPLIPGNLNTYFFSTKALSVLNTFHNLKIVNIETNNVILKTKDYINNNLNMNSVDANNNFAIGLSIDGTREYDLIQNGNFDNFENEAFVGYGKVRSWKYTIYNANNLSDNITDRYIIITYKSNNGLILKQKIIINREIKKATNPVSSIVEGSRYGLFDENQEGIGINKKSSFTAQFVLNYIPKFYTDKNLFFDQKLPVGTKITLYDYVKDENPTYWYYKVDREIIRLNISDFNKMGSINKKYNNSSENNYIKEVYVLIFDFKDVERNRLAKMTFTFEMNGEKSEKYTSNSLFAGIYREHTFNLNQIPNNLNIKDSINLNYNVNFGNLGRNTYFDDKKLSYVITVDEDFPKDAYLLVKDSNSEMKEAKYFRNSKNQFIFSAGELMNFLFNDISCQFYTDVPLKKTKYNVKVELMLSKTSDARKPLMGDVLATKNVVLENTIEENSSIEIMENTNRIFTKNDLKNNQILKIKYLHTSRVKISVEFQQKVSNEYITLKDKLISVDGRTQNKDGVFELNLKNGDNDVLFKFSEMLNTGTYRFIVKVKDFNDNTIYEIPYAIIISENIDGN